MALEHNTSASPQAPTLSVAELSVRRSLAAAALQAETTASDAALTQGSPSVQHAFQLDGTVVYSLPEFLHMADWRVIMCTLQTPAYCLCIIGNLAAPAPTQLFLDKPLC